MNLNRLVMFMVVTLFLVVGIAYSKDKVQDPHLQVKHVDVCINWYRFRYVYQGEKLVNMFQVFEIVDDKSLPAKCNFGPYNKKTDKEEDEGNGEVQR